MNAEQKQRAQSLLNEYRPGDDAPHVYHMAALLQELVDAPEPEPVAWNVEGKDGETMCVTDNKFAADRYIACGYVVEPLYPAPQPPSVPDEQLQAAFDRGLKAGNEQGIAQQVEIHKLHKILAAATTPAEAPADVARDARLQVESEFAALLPGVTYMDEPDGGTPTVQEQIARMAMDAERWAPIADFNGIYEVSTIGRIRSVTRIDSDNNRRLAKYLTPTAIRKGYLKVCLWNGGERIERYVHRLVASAFIENPGHLPQVNHKDGDPANNEVSNLEWVTNAQNQTHARRILAKGVRAVYGISLTDGSRIDFASLELAVEAGFVRANIQKCISGTRKKHKGYAWYDAAIDSAIAAEKGGAR